jgi:hypothetical protein
LAKAEGLRYERPAERFFTGPEGLHYNRFLVTRRPQMRAVRLFALLVIALITFGAFTAQRAVPTTVPSPKAVDAAKAFLAKLDDRQRTKVVLPLNTTTRTVWSNLPTGVAMQVGALERNGLKLGDMTPAQQDAALAVVAATLSGAGFQKVMNIVNADQQLELKSAPDRAANSKIKFGRAEYYVAFLGAPSAADRWMLQFGGHHLAINVSIAGQKSVLTPTHTGAQPATYTLNGQTIRPLGSENDKAFKLVNGLDAAQRKQAVLGYEVRNLVLGPGEDGKVIQPEGVRASTLNQTQRAMLVDLVREWVDILDDAAAGAKMTEITANLADTYFAWSGSTSNGDPAYFRVQGPTVLIEYAPQGSSRASTDHIHTIYRDPTNDYGPKLTAQ